MGYGKTPKPYAFIKIKTEPMALSAFLGGIIRPGSKGVISAYPF